MTTADSATGGELESLEEERDFLLRSLADLDAEHQAGDIDERDYRTLTDDYTARAAAVLHAIDALSSPSQGPSARKGAPVAAGAAGRGADGRGKGQSLRGQSGNLRSAGAGRGRMARACKGRPAAIPRGSPDGRR